MLQSPGDVLVAPTHEYTIDGRRMVVLDGVLPRPEINRLALRAMLAPFTRTGTDAEETRHIRVFVRQESLEEFVGTPLHAQALAAVARHFPDVDLSLHRVDCNLTVYGDMAHAHRDCAPGRRDVTALYYLNPEWRKNWGGETIFFDDAGDAVYAIACKPGRLVLFEGAIEHRVGIPLRSCHDQRLTLAIRFMAPPADADADAG